MGGKQRLFLGKYQDFMLDSYVEASNLTKKKVLALIYVYPLFIISGLLFIFLYMAFVDFTSDVVFVSVGLCTLLIGWFLAGRGHYHISVLIMLLVLLVILSATVFYSHNHEPIKMYNLAVYCILSLLIAGLVADRAVHTLVVMVLSLFLMTTYLLFFVIPADLKPFELTIDAYIAATVLTVLSAVISLLVHRQMNGLIDELTRMNTDLDRLVVERTEELESSQRQLIETEKIASLSGMVAGVVHEVNTPLGVCITAQSHFSEVFTDYLAKQESDFSATDEELEDLLALAGLTDKLLERNLYRLKELTKQLRTLSINTLTEAAENQNITDELNLVRHIFDRQMKSAGCISISILNTNSLFFRITPVFCRQVLSQLVENALLHAFPGGSGNIILEARRDGTELFLRVSDDGLGIATENLDRLFDPFFTTVRGQGRKGLGMMLVYNSVTTLGGRIQVDSESGVGTTVTITVPES